MVATKRRWNPNVQKVAIVLKGKPTRAYVCTKCLKAHKVQKTG
jgi:large subunit ribosomal protein L28